MDLIKITPNKERAKNILETVQLLENRIIIQDRKTMSSLILADYYEIMKELITAILFVDGYKTLNHTDLIEYISNKYKELNKNDINILNNIRILRHKVSYEGYKAPSSYLERNEEDFKMIINKLKEILNEKINN